MIPKPTPECDACKKPIDTSTAYIQFQPLRGGLNLIVISPAGTAGQQINRRMDFCDATCVGVYTDAMKKTIKPAIAPVTKPAATVAPKA